MNKITEYIICAFFCAALCSCSSDVQNSASVTETTTAAVTTTKISMTKYDTVTEPIKPKPSYKKIKAEVTGYKDDKLYFTYEGRDYVLDIDEKQFNEHYGPIRHIEKERLFSDLVINNRFSEKIIGKITLTEDMSKIVECDVVTPNLKEYHGTEHYLHDGTPDSAYFYSFRKTGGSKCVISNPDETLEFDMSELSVNNLLILKDEYPLVMFTAYKFKDGNMILGNVRPAKIADNGYLYSDSNDGQYKPLLSCPISYFGTVQKNENGKADILLNDGKTVITVPSYYNDGDVLAGAEVLVDLRTEKEELFGTGKHAEYDFAIIYTREKYYNTSPRRFDELAYAYVDSSRSSYYTYISKSGEKIERIQ